MRVTIDVKPYGHGCLVRIQEEAVRGPAAVVPRRLSDALLRWRNAESMHRLAYLAEGIQPESEDTTAHREDAATQLDTTDAATERDADAATEADRPETAPPAEAP